jgi:hypothetical protein
MPKSPAMRSPPEAVDVGAALHGGDQVDITLLDEIALVARRAVGEPAHGPGDFRIRACEAAGHGLFGQGQEVLQLALQVVDQAVLEAPFFLLESALTTLTPTPCRPPAKR